MVGICITYLDRYQTWSIIFTIISLGVKTPLELHEDLNIKIDLPTEKAGDFSIFAIGGASEVAFWADEYLASDVFALYNVDIQTRTQFGLTGLTHKKFITEKSYLKTTVSYLFEN